MVFVPFLGDFLSIRAKRNSNYHGIDDGFRPLSWGLSFNTNFKISKNGKFICFRPLSWGLSFNISKFAEISKVTGFSSPFLGTFFQ